MRVANRLACGLVSLALLLGCPQSVKETESKQAVGEGAKHAQGGTGCDLDRYKAPRVTHFVQSAIIRIARPTYPEDALEKGVQGRVNVDVVIDREGNVVEACALSGPLELRKAAETAALSCKFKKNFGLEKPSPRLYQRDVLVYLFVVDPERVVDDVHSIVVRPEN